MDNIPIYSHWNLGTFSISLTLLVSTPSRCPVCSWDSALQLRLSVGNKSIHLFLGKTAGMTRTNGIWPNMTWMWWWMMWEWTFQTEWFMFCAKRTLRRSFRMFFLHAPCLDKLISTIHWFNTCSSWFFIHGFSWLFTTHVLDATKSGWWLSQPLWKNMSSSVGMIFHSQLNGKSFKIPWFQSAPTRNGYIIVITTKPHYDIFFRNGWWIHRLWWKHEILTDQKSCSSLMFWMLTNHGF